MPSEAEALENLLLASTAAVDRMRDMINALERQGWPLFAHSLYLPMVQLERAVRDATPPPNANG